MPGLVHPPATTCFRGGPRGPGMDDDDFDNEELLLALDQLERNLLAKGEVALLRVCDP